MMNQTTAIQRLSQWEHKGRYVYTDKDLTKLFPEDSPRALKAGLSRLTSSGVLTRAVKGIYVFTLTKGKRADTLELIARTMRRGEYNYVSLESALSEYGAISQIPVDRLTVMTTGRKGEYKTPFGTIEFTHTKRSVSDIVQHIKEVGRPLRIADKWAALRDLKRVGRNMDLVDEAVLHED